MVQELLQEMTVDNASDDEEDQVIAEVESKITSANEEEEEDDDQKKKRKRRKKRKRKTPSKSSPKPKSKKKKRTKKPKKTESKEIDEETPTQVLTEDPEMNAENGELLPVNKALLYATISH